VQDTLDESNESIIVDIANVTNANESTTQQITTTIIDDDLPPSVTLGVAPLLIAETGGTSTVTATLSALSGQNVTIELAFSGTATNGSDYTRTATQIVIPAGSISGTTRLTALQDSLSELNETIVVDITNVTYGTESGNQQVTATITDAGDRFEPNDSFDTATNFGTLGDRSEIGLSVHATNNVDNYRLTAAGNGNLIVTLSFLHSQGDLDLYVFNAAQTVISSSVGTGNTEMVNVPVVSGQIYFIRVIGYQGSTNPNYDMIIDGPSANALPSVALAAGTADIAEASGSATVSATLSSVSSQAVTVNLAFSGTATNISDYTRSNIQIVIPAGNLTGTVTLNATQDTLDEPDETILVEIASVTNGTELGTQQVTATIRDDDASPNVALSVVPSAIEEAAGFSTITATLASLSGQDVTVNLEYSGTATSGTDYTRSDALIVIPAGSLTGTATVTALQDVVDETNETIIVDIVNVVNGAELGTQQVTATISDDDAVPTVTLSIDQASMVEATGTSTVTATLSSKSERPVTIDLAYTGTATNATDYSSSALQIVIPAGNLIGTVTLTAVQDTLDEINETILIDIVGATNGEEFGVQQVAMMITDDDTPPSVALSVAPTSIAETAGVATVTATLSMESGQDVTVDLTFSGTASNLSDYIRSASQIVIPAGKTTGTVTLTAVADTVADGNETVVIDVLAVANGTASGSQQRTITITDEANQANTLQVTSFTPTSSGFVVQFSRELNASRLNLYDTEAGELGVSDVIVEGTAAGILRGSIVVDPSLRKVSFLKTGELLAADTYSVTLRSAGNGFIDTTESQLDGDANGTAGGDFKTSFVVDGAENVVVSVPDFARGFGQQVNVPASQTGIPLTLSNGTGVLSVDLEIFYDPSLLTITAANVPVGLPGSVALNNLTPGIARLSYNTSTALTNGAVTFVNLTARVLDTAPYGSKHILDISNLKINEGAIAGRDDDGIHLAAFLGDATGNQSYSGLDAAMISRVVVGLDKGFGAYRLADPLIIADVTGNGTVSGLDASSVSQRVVGLSVSKIPALPLGINPPPAAVGPNPKISIPQDLSVAPGKTVTVPIVLDVTEPAGISFLSADYAITFDSARFSVSSVRLGTINAGFSITTNLNDSNGTLQISTSSSGAPLKLQNGFSGNVILMDFTAKAGAVSGASTVDLERSLNGTATSLNEGGLTLVPNPTDGSNDSVDGIVTVLVADLPNVTIGFDNPSISEPNGVATLTARLSKVSDLAITVNLSFTGTAITGSDYAVSGTQIVIPAGLDHATFTFAAVEDLLVEGSETIVVDIVGVTNGKELGEQLQTATIFDRKGTLSLAIDVASISERGGVARGTVVLSDLGSTEDLIVTIRNSDSSEVIVSPATITIPAHQSMATFSVIGIEDALLDGTQTVVLRAEVPGYESGVANLDVADFETLTVSINPGAISEDRGGTTGTVTRSNTDISQEEVVTLTSSDLTEATVPATVIIPANQASQTFEITAVDDSILDGVQDVTINASSLGYFDGSAKVTVTDFETLSVTIDATSISEKNGAAIGTVSRSNSNNDGSLTVTLESSDTTEATVTPRVIMIPANQSSVKFSISGIDDALLDGTQPVSIKGSAENYVSIESGLDITDFETLAIAIDPPSISENGGFATGTVTRSNTDNSQPLLVNLVSSDTTEAAVSPSTVTIPANQSSVTFLITAVDDASLDGTQIVTFTATTPGYSLTTTTIDVIDFENFELIVDKQSFRVTEDGTIDQIFVSLPTKPTSLVKLIVANPDTTELQPELTELTFSPDNWNQPQALRFRGIADLLDDGEQLLSVLIKVDTLHSAVEYADIKVEMLAHVDDSPASDFDVTFDQGELLVAENATRRVLQRTPVTAEGSVVATASGGLTDTFTIQPFDATGLNLRIDAAAGNDRFVVSRLNFDQLNGGPGIDELDWIAKSLPLDLSQLPDSSLVSIEVINLVGGGKNILTAKAGDFARVITETSQVIIRMDSADDALLQGEWTVDKPVFESGTSYHSLRREGLALKIANDRIWTNPVNPLDIDRNGVVQPLDALVEINYLNRGGSNLLPTPTGLADLPTAYLDPTGNGRAEPLDALLVINFLNRRATAEPEEQRIAPFWYASSFGVGRTTPVSRDEEVPNILSTSTLDPGLIFIQSHEYAYAGYSRSKELSPNDEDSETKVLEAAVDEVFALELWPTTG
jgi:hypothetical protein